MSDVAGQVKPVWKHGRLTKRHDASGAYKTEEWVAILWPDGQRILVSESHHWYAPDGSLLKDPAAIRELEGLLHGTHERLS